MRDATPQTIYLEDYQVPDFLIDKTDLHFDLLANETLVTADLQMRRNPASLSGPEQGLQLSGIELELMDIAIDGQTLGQSEYQIQGEVLHIINVPDQFNCRIKTRIKPHENTALEGLYQSGGMYCTQCEAEGFRRITYYLDRPDVMSLFTTTIEADKKAFPVLLSNGNPVAQGDLDNGRHFAKWDDPFKKPCYLFALVAGELRLLEDSFTTMSGRQIDLRIYVEPQNIDKCDYAMDALKRSMAWDEKVYGREYDLDLFMIVAVDAFNMGAMENKGLNIFNTSCVLAKSDTATDAAYQRIEAVVAHEYFHNWSGNRVTCRDWFQLSLKEGFTVFRDAEFSADMNSRTVKRVEDVNLLRTVQFSEDAGPMSHPVRPESFIEISNFYTVTIYEKGAEVVRMIHTLLGDKAFRRGSDLYFERHDGQAVTCEDFVKAMEDASGIDLQQFRRWYSQAGTPVLQVSDQYDADQKQYSLTVKQSCPASSGQGEKQPFHIPLSLGLIDAQGGELQINIQDEASTQFNPETGVLSITESEQTFVFSDVASKPVPSLLRGFSAPVKLHYPYSRDELVFLMANDRDGYNRWEACQQLAVEIIQELALVYRTEQSMVLDGRLTRVVGQLLADTNLDAAMVAKMLTLPSENYLAELAEQVDVEALYQARRFVRQSLVEQLKTAFLQCYQRLQQTTAYQPEPGQMANRALKNLCLSYLSLLCGDESEALMLDQFERSDNMTDVSAALACLISSNSYKKQQCINNFYQKWREDALVVNQWFSLQAGSAEFADIQQIQTLCKHPDFDIKNPNKVRSLVGVFAGQNLLNFHKIDGSGYKFLTDQIITLNELNPQIAARLLGPLTKWRKFDHSRQQLMTEQLKRIMAAPNLSKDVFEVVSKSLQA